CMYCEALVRDVSFGEIEHIKPKIKYQHLEFVWENLGFICQRCNNHKRDQYEDAMPYINPYDEDPEEFLLASGAYVVQKQGNARGEKTIMDISLNRPELIEHRQELLNRVQKAIDAAFRTPDPLKTVLLEQLKLEASKEREFSFVISSRLALESI